MAINSRMIVAPPTKTPLGGGLFSVVDLRPEPPTPQWRKGVTWQNICPDPLNTTFDVCIATGSGATVTGATVTGAAPAKAATGERSTWGATAFTVYGEVDCSPDQEWWNNGERLVRDAFTEAEQQTVETVFMTGYLGDQQLQFPHLAATAEVLDEQGATLQLPVTELNSGAGTEAVLALGAMEQALGACVMGLGVIHMPETLATILTSKHLITQRAGKLYSPAGHLIAASPAYTGVGPTGLVTTGALWMYGTGPVFMYKSAGRFIGPRNSMLDRTINTMAVIYERTYLIGYDCCLIGVAVDTELTP
jgi:hypothetical protein